MAIFKKKYQKYSDEQLMEFIQAGNTGAFDELYFRFSKKLLHYFYRMLGEEGKAQDFLQEIFLKIVEKPQLFDSKKKFYSWIFSVANNMCKNEYRRKEVRKHVNQIENMDDLSHESKSDYFPAEKKFDQKQFRSALQNELTKMEIEQQTTFLLRFQQNLSIREISDILECSEGTIKSRLFYTTKKLASKLKDYNPNKTEVSLNAKIR
jgi:RNA polymerase sigma-70 factor, ECF subfamily